MVRRGRVRGDIDRRFRRRVCGDQSARRGVRLVGGGVGQGVAAQLGVFAAAGARARGDGGDEGRGRGCWGARRAVCYARAGVHRAQDVPADSDGPHRRLHA